MNQPARQLSRYGWRPADPPRRPVLFINPRSGDGKAARARLADGRDTRIETRGTRPALDSGRLGIVVLDAPGDSPRVPGRAWSAPRLEVDAPAPVHAGVDGEAVDLDSPLRSASRPVSLRVRISARHLGASPSARLHLPGYPPGLEGRDG